MDFKFPAVMDFFFAVSLINTLKMLAASSMYENK